MKRNNQWLLGLAGAALIAGTVVGALGDVKSNPYDLIVERNPFGLKPPPPPVDPESLKKPEPPAPLAQVELTGIVSVLDKKKALLEIIPAPGKPVIKPILTEGERVETVEVVSINLEKYEVTIKNGTLLTNLTFKVAKSTPAAPAAPDPLAPPVNAAPPAQSSAFNFNQPNSGGRSQVMMAGGSSAPAANVAGGQPAVNALGGGTTAGTTFGGGVAATPTLNDGLRTIPQRNIRTPTPASDPQQEVNRAQQYLNLRLQEEAARQKNVPFPPTPPIPGLDGNLQPHQ